MSVPATDVFVRDEGSIVLLIPATEAAHAWIDEHVDPDAMWFGNGIVVEHRFVDDIIDGMHAYGLIVAGAEVAA